MNQGKLEVVKQEMARVNVNILGISELKWTRKGEFNSDDHYVYYCGQKSLGRNRVVLIVNRQRRQWQPTPVRLPGKSHGWRSLVGCSPCGHEELNTTERLHFHALEKEMATHSSVLAWRIPGMGEPGGLPSVGSHRVGHD